MMGRFRDRTDAGRQLGSLLAAYRDRPDVIVLALPRGGVPVGYEVARQLQCPLDVFVVRKLGVPGHQELAMGAVAMGGIRVLNLDVVSKLGIDPEVVDSVTRSAFEAIDRRVAAYRGARLLPAVGGRTAILVDDGLATGATMKAAVAAVRQQHPARVVVAVPVAARTTVDDLEAEGLADEVVCCLTPEPFHAVGSAYDDFTQTSDAEVGRLLAEAAHLSS